MFCSYDCNVLFVDHFKIILFLVLRSSVKAVRSCFRTSYHETSVFNE